MQIYKVSIDTQKNDLVDYKAGGPIFLGFDFFIEKNILTKNEIRNKIEDIIIKLRGAEDWLNISIYEIKDTEKHKKIWDWTEIEENIKKEEKWQWN